MNKPGTAQLQQWMNEVITCQGSMQYKLGKAQHLHQLNEKDVVALTRNVSIYSRINVYTSGYVMRLLECISADFPMLQKFMGGEVFDHFAKAALMWSPSTSYSLYDLGDTFIRFLDATRPAHTTMAENQNALLELPIEIARTERARQQALRSKGTEDTHQAETEIFSADILFGAHQLMVCAPDCLRLLTLKFPVKQLFSQLHQQVEYDMPAPQQTYVAISRMHYRLTMEELQHWQYIFLSGCTQPVSVTEAIAATAALSGVPASTLMADLCIWLPIFRSNGFLLVL